MLRFASGTAGGLIEHQPVTLHRLTSWPPASAIQIYNKKSPSSARLHRSRGRRGEQLEPLVSDAPQPSRFARSHHHSWIKERCSAIPIGEIAQGCQHRHRTASSPSIRCSQPHWGSRCDGDGAMPRRCRIVAGLWTSPAPSQLTACH
jgi:hypothetical protein